ncbi:MAG: tRNA (guanosine(46)-N7)-methyltransferase TrmB [Kiloniellaceae bacterium]
MAGHGSASQATPGAVRRNPRRAFHGRRTGRRLRPGLRSLLAELLPRLRVEPPAPGERLDPARLFGRAHRGLGSEICWPKEVWLEIGFGSGEHLAWQAERHPDVGFIGAEYFVNGIAGLLRRVSERGIENLRIYQGDGRDLLDALPEGSLDRVFILFPDPWPKTRHHKRRIIRRETLDRLAAVMKDGVELRLATDDMGYLRWMLERLVRHPGFEWLARGPRDWRERPADWPPTRYECKALHQGRRAGYLRFRRRPREG